MMYYLVFVGAVAFTFGVLFLLAPQSLRDLSEKVNKHIGSIDEKLYTLRVGTGISLILVSVLSFMVVYFLTRM